MKLRSVSLFLVVATLSAAAGWWAATQRTHPHAPMGGEPAAAGAAGERKILFYQSAMHPWIKSDKPGKCTICGMPLTPVFEGQQGLDAGKDIITLGSGSVTVSGVRTEAVSRQKLHKTLRVAGVLDDDDTRHRRLSAVIEGRIEELHVQFVGAEVVEGDPLATFHSLPLLALEREYLGVIKQLEQAPDTLRPGLEKMRQAAETRLLLMGITRKQISALPQRPEDAHLVEIVSPMTGTVVSREVYAGQYVKEGDKLFEIADFSTMWFKFDAYERDLPWLKPGQPVDIKTPSRPGKVYQASIRFIDPNLNEATRSAKVRVEVPNPLIEENGRKRRELLHRLYAEGLVDIALPEVLTVPRTAVLNPNGEPVVYIDRGEGHYQQRKVTLGRMGDSAWEVLQGLEEGDKVVTMGNLLLDSQAQLNAGNTAQEAAAAPAPSGATLGPEGERAVQNFLAAVSDLAGALASEDLERFNAQRSLIQEALAPFLSTLTSATQYAAAVPTIQKAAQLPAAPDLPGARASFYSLSTPIAEFFRTFRRGRPDLAAYQLFQCPMTSKSFPGAPKSALWLQKSGTLRNPYLGAEMLDCGTEIKP